MTAMSARPFPFSVCTRAWWRASLVLALLAVLLRAGMPAGVMPVVGPDKLLTLSFCSASGASPAWQVLLPVSEPEPGHAADTLCPFGLASLQSTWLPTASPVLVAARAAAGLAVSRASGHASPRRVVPGPPLGSRAPPFWQVG